jgi:hypothetical protein
VVVVVWVKVVVVQEPLELRVRVTAAVTGQATSAVGHLIEAVAVVELDKLVLVELLVHRAQLMLVKAVME